MPIQIVITNNVAPSRPYALRLVAVLGAMLLSVSASGQTKPIVLELSKPEATSSAHFGLVLSVAPLANGKLLVNDGLRRQLIVLDAALSNGTVLIDSVAVGGQAYGPVASPLIPYIGDSTLFVDGVARALLLIGPQGTIVRTMAPPKPADLMYLTFGTSGTDKNGNLIYLSRFQLLATHPTENETSIVPNDSAPIMRANFDTRTTDTLTRLRQSNAPPVSITQSGGVTTMRTKTNPLVAIDEWAVLSDGTAAVVRGHDYHVDLIRTDGSRISGPKLPFTFKRLTDADKEALIDSSRKAMEQRDREIAADRATGAGGAAGATGAPRPAPAAAPPPGGFVAFGVERNDQARPAGPPKTINDFTPLNEIADYWPPIRRGAVKADLDNNLWILPTTATPVATGELLWDVVNNRGEFVHRVRTPAGKTIAGFGKNGVVYLMYKDGDAGWKIERTKVVSSLR